MRTRGYGPYRGRSPFKRFLKILGIILVVLVILGFAASAYLQQFLVVSDDGVRLNLPSSPSETPDVAPSHTVSVDAPVVVTPEPTPTPTPTPVSDALVPVLLPAEALYDGSAAEQMETLGGDCVVFDMKADDGMLNYVSTLKNAVEGGLNPDDPERNDAIRTLNETAGLHTVARVSCFKDHGLILYDRNMAIFTNSGYRWTDPDGIRWSSPTTADVRDYVTAVCVELAELGFDEILLDNAGYPSEGNLHYIKKGAAYDASQFSSVIDGFYAQVAYALAQYDVTLSVVTTQEALAGTDALTGQAPANLARMDRLWVADETGQPTPMEPLSSSS